MINSRILHVSIDIVIQFSNVEMYKDLLVLDTCYGYLFIILYNDLLVALENIFVIWSLNSSLGYRIPIWIPF